MTLADSTTHTTALVALLATAGVVVGDATAPTVRYAWQGTPGRSRFIPYAVVYLLDQAFDGSLGCPDSDSDLSWQVTCIGETRATCDTVRHAVNTALIGASLTVAGRSVARIRAEGGAAIRRDDSLAPALFIATPRFAAWST